MIAFEATVQQGRIQLNVPGEFPEGARVRVNVELIAPEKLGIDESEWRDDPAALADWEAWIQTIEPLDLTPDEQAALVRFQEEMRRFNIEAVRKQMEEGLFQ
jgi:hypothetical protein